MVEQVPVKHWVEGSSPSRGVPLTYSFLLKYAEFPNTK